MRAIFVVGTGRSGTHFTTRLLNDFENTYDPLNGKEDPEILQNVAGAAIHHRLPSTRIGKKYQKRLQHKAGIFLDQHHPNLFFVTHWATLLEGIIFLYPQRPIYQIVASMLRHNGVMYWYQYAKKWRCRAIKKLPYPNQFLGVRRLADIDALPPHILCAHRVIAHQKTFEHSVPKMNGSLRSIEYEGLIDDPMREFSRIFSAAELTKLGKFSLTEQPNPHSLTKFHDVLTEEQVSEINALERRSNSSLKSSHSSNGHMR